MKEVRPLFDGNIIENFSEIPISSTGTPHLVKISPIYVTVYDKIRKILFKKGYETTFILMLEPNPRDKSSILAHIRYSKERFPEDWTWAEQMRWLKHRGLRKIYEFTYDELGYGFISEFPDNFEGYSFRYKEMYKEELFLFAKKYYEVDEYDELETQFDDLPRNKWVKIEKNVVIPHLFLWGEHTIEGWIYIRRSRHKI